MASNAGVKVLVGPSPMGSQGPVPALHPAPHLRISAIDELLLFCHLDLVEVPDAVAGELHTILTETHCELHAADILAIADVEMAVDDDESDITVEDVYRAHRRRSQESEEAGTYYRRSNEADVVPTVKPVTSLGGAADSGGSCDPVHPRTCDNVGQFVSLVLDEALFGAG